MCTPRSQYLRLLNISVILLVHHGISGGKGDGDLDPVGEHEDETVDEHREDDRSRCSTCE